MQTFLPYPSFSKSAQVLDYRRLGKQRVEARQLVMAIEGLNGWSHHPATKMWKRYVPALKHYHDVMIDEWESRGYINGMERFYIEEWEAPWWLGWDRFHLSHQSNLLRKDKKYYSKYFNIPSNLPYIWPGEENEIVRHAL